jgi:O-succinylhomoserine sulfhydrylase
MADGADGGKNAEKKNWRAQTLNIHGGSELRSPYGETSEAIYLTSGYVYDSAGQARDRFTGDDEGYVYSRYGNPTVSMFEERMRLLEGAQAAMATSSGMAAVNAVLMSIAEQGARIVASKALFGASLYLLNQLLPRFGVETVLVDGSSLDEWRTAAGQGADLFFLESPTNPTLELVDIAAVAQIAHEAGGVLAVDNVFASPVLQKPLELGADIVLYSATKHIDGQGRCLGGVVLGAEEYINGPLREYIRQSGPSLSPFNAWVMLKGLETLGLRMERHCANAARLADFLAAHDKVVRLIYPGRKDHPQHELAMRQMNGSGGPMLAFELKGGQDAAFTFMNALEIVRICNNLGDAKSLITHPATTTHQRLSDEERAELGINSALVRLSVGLEDTGDLIADLDQALGAVGV